MQIQFLGHSCFRLKGREMTLITDPYEPSIGINKLPRLSADIVTISHDHQDHNFFHAIEKADHRSSPFLISGPGEYEVGGVFVLGISSFHDKQQGKERGKNTIFVIKMDGLSLVHLGDLGHQLNDEQLEQINGVDILFVPTGGVFTIDAKEAAAVVAQIEPKVVIPMHYQEPGLKYDLAKVDDFLTQMGHPEVKPLPKFLVSPESLPMETEILVLGK